MTDIQSDNKSNAKAKAKRDLDKKIMEVSKSINKGMTLRMLDSMKK
jgi:hypothetical protein